MSARTRRFDFFRVFSKNTHFGELLSFYCFNRKVNTVVVIEGGLSLSRSQNDKTRLITL